MNLDQDQPKPVSKPKKAVKRKLPKIKPGAIVTPSSAENARQLQLAKKKKV